MSQKPLISVIVPVYNVESYLVKCIQSILGQTYSNLEIILVDDGSTDASGQICDEYAKKDSRIKVIHKKNEGVSIARNTALDCMRGAFVGFVDSDDEAAPEMFETLYDNLIKNEADVSVCGFNFCHAGSSIRNNNEDIQMVFSAEDAISNMLIGRYFAGHLWNKLFKASLFKSIRLNENISVYEDLLVVTEAFLNCKRIVFDSIPLYNYLMRENSACHKELSEKSVTAHSACLRIERILKESGFGHLQKYVDASILICNINFIDKMSYDKAGKRKYAKFAKRNIRSRINFKALQLMTFGMKVRLLLAAINLNLYLLIMRIKICAGKRK